MTQTHEVENEYPWMHLYAQYIEHSPATIRGNVEALRKLRDAITEAIEGGTGEAKDIFASDGEGYSIEVQRVNTIAALGTPQYIWHEFELGTRALEYERKNRSLSPKAEG